MAQAYLIRHPQVAAPGICYGRSEPDLAEGALAAALTRCAPALPQDLAAPLACSPALRARSLAQALQDMRGVAHCHIVPAFQEIDFGVWEGQSWDQIGAAALDAWLADPLHFAAAGAESLYDLAQRVWRGWRDLRAQFPQGVIVVCHGGPMRILAAWRDTPQLRQTEAPEPAALAQAAWDSVWRPQFGEVLQLPY